MMNMHVLQTLLTQAPVVVSGHLGGGNRKNTNHLCIPCDPKRVPEQWLSLCFPVGDDASS